MSFGKSFIVSLVSLIALNVVIFAIFYSIGYGFDQFITGIVSNATYILYVLFGSTAHAIWFIADSFLYSFGTDPISWDFFLLNLSFIVAPLLAAVITGRLSEKRVHAFAGFFLTTIICMLVSIILVYQGFAYQVMLAGEFFPEPALIKVILGSLVNGFIYGMVAYLTTKK
jgi:hypothetical protein